MSQPAKDKKAESQMTLTSSRSVRMQNRTEGGWYQRRTRIEKVLLVTTFLVLFVVVGLAISLASVISGFNLATNHKLHNSKHSSSLKSPELQSGNVCLTEGCVEAAAKILGRIDSKVDPCENFHLFSCGKYERNLIIPDEKSAVTEFSLINDALEEKLRLLIDKDVSFADSTSTILVKNLYKSCMDVGRIESQGIKPLQNILAGLGGWPVVEGKSWNSSKFSWTDVIYNNRKIGYSVDYLFDFSVAVDVRNSSWRIIDLDQPALGMPSRKYFLKGLNDSSVKAYHEYQVSMAMLLGAKRKAAEKELKQALLFETHLAKFSKNSEDRRNISEMYNKMTLSQLKQIVPDISWLEYANKILPQKTKVTESEPVLIAVPEYFIKLSKLLKATPKRVVANYLMWRVVSSSVGFLSDEARDIQLKYSKQLTGKGMRAPRWKECMGVVSGSLSHAVGALYAKNFFKENAKDEADEMVSFIRNEFDKILRAVDWMDPKTRIRALRKSRKISSHIAYPKEILDERNLEELYEDLHISDGDFLENMRNLTIFGTDFSFGELREKVDKGHWRNYGSAAVVNAFYSQVENSIQFPAGILQGIFFNADRPRYLNYGAIGFVIGHEVTHGFDDRGRQFDENGDLFNWWDSETQKKFVEKAECMVWQYGNYSVPEVGLNVNGVNTQGENIADNGGIKEAYRAYRQWAYENREEQKLPGLPYDPNQLFWISAAHVWCSKYRPETLKLRIITGFHAPVQFRINGPMSNIEEFSADWSCPLGSKMNPLHKCKVW